MRIVTVPFVTVIELTAPCWTRSNRYKIKPLLISITSFLQEVLTATGRPVHTALSDGFFIVAQQRMEVNGFRGGERLGSGFAVHVAGRKRLHRTKRPFARLGEVRGKRPGRGYDYWEKGSRISQNAKYGFLSPARTRPDLCEFTTSNSCARLNVNSSTIGIIMLSYTSPAYSHLPIYFWLRSIDETRPKEKRLPLCVRIPLSSSHVLISLIVAPFT